MILLEAMRVMRRRKVISIGVICIAFLFLVFGALKSFAWAASTDSSMLASVTRTGHELVIMLYQRTHHLLSWFWGSVQTWDDSTELLIFASSSAHIFSNSSKGKALPTITSSASMAA